MVEVGIWGVEDCVGGAYTPVCSFVSLAFVVYDFVMILCFVSLFTVVIAGC